jgi:DUF4097 and DUF4098 domain-containing protein YvlB
MKNLIKTSFVILISFSLSLAYGQSTRSVDYFDQISVSASVNVKLIKSDVQKVEFKMISGDEESLVTEVKNKKLIIKIKSGMFNWNNKAKASVKVYYTELNEIEASAGSSIKAEELIRCQDMDIEVSSGAVADLEIEAESIDAEVSSGGRIILEGSARNGDFEVSSGANLDASDMICDIVSADASSGGQMKIYVNKKLRADASSGGSISYKGNVEYTHTDSGWSGQIKRMN